MAEEARQLKHISVQGVVQGVGFRPFIFRLAHEHNLTGWVLNTSSKVEIEVEGTAESIARFVQRLAADAPPLARIEAMKLEAGSPKGYTSFEIKESQQDAGYQLISPDIATCRECVKELFDVHDRRFRYPFTNCTNCGPRFTIISDIPYDRRNTTMSVFRLCDACRSEYEDPLNRRFHAQPTACPVCGPKVWLETADGRLLVCADAIKEAAQLLASGSIIAIKGLGGFHLACDAGNGQAVDTLRMRKGRPHKPLAVMMSNLDEVRKECACDAEEAKLLVSPHAPIVLLRWKTESQIDFQGQAFGNLSSEHGEREGEAPTAGYPRAGGVEGATRAPFITRNVAPGNNYLGVMLAYTPLHHLLLHDVGRPLVMTSGNIAEEPIAKDNNEAKRRLKGLADYFLLHDRDIHSRYDDSVYMVVEEKPQPIRRARSYAPFPARLPFKSLPLLAVGAQEKSTFCLARDEYAFVSQHIGDLENIETIEHFATTVELYKRLFRITPELIAHDLHPDYLATRYAIENKGSLPIVGVQHHHAHIASCMMDNGITEPVIGVAFDGSGWGPDNTVWGGEFFVADLLAFRRVGRIEPLPLPGGELAIKKPYRIAIAYLYRLFGSIPELPFLRNVAEEERHLIARQVDKGINTPLTSSCGRLCDAVSALLDVCKTITFEGQAAIELEMRSTGTGTRRPYAYGLEEQNRMWQVRVRPILEAILNDIRSGVPVQQIGLRFHDTLARVIEDVATRVAAETGIARVALSGGCFQNRLLLRRTLPLLRAAGLNVLLHRQAPCNDGGISLGQAAIAHAVASQSPLK